MAILYPDEIEDIYILGTKFTGNVVSVGKDGNYPYDYDHPRTATNSEPNGTLVLIYPGSYSMYFNNNMSNRDVLWRGMGNSPTDIVMYGQATEYTILRVGGNYNIVILDNVGSNIAGVAFGNRDLINFNDGASSTNIYVNKCNFGYSASRSGDAMFGFVDYEGNAYFSYTKVYTGDSRNSQYESIGVTNINATYQFYGLEYARSYNCLSCAKAPDPHIYNVGAAENYGYNYGKYLIQFVPTPDPIIYQNVWAVDDYIYHTVPSGIDVYNSDASVLDYHIALPDLTIAVWANDSYIYMGTVSNGVYRSTISGVASSYLTAPDINSNDVIYLHGADDYLCISTTSGVDRYDVTISSGIYTVDTGIHKCYQTTSGTLYYLENNLFFGLDESSNGLDGDLRTWKYYNHITFTATTDNYTQVKVNIEYDFPYDHIKGYGEDLRFLDLSGKSLNYYVKDWYPTGVVIVDVDAPDIIEFYMLYGNANASTQASFLHDIGNNEVSSTEENLLWSLIKPKLHAVYIPSTNWVAADYIYEDFYGDPLILNDIHITEGTSSYSDDNTIFLATDRGAYVIEERQGNEENSNQKRYYIS